MKRSALAAYVVDDGTSETTLTDFIEANDFDEDTIEALVALRIGETYSEGGGAAAEWTIKRVR